jgi:hypothetical protein
MHRHCGLALLSALAILTTTVVSPADGSDSMIIPVATPRSAQCGYPVPRLRPIDGPGRTTTAYQACRFAP